jgi:phosphatidylglycerophosphate synthase
MKDLHLIVWLSQLGFSVAFPLAGFILLAVWLRNNCNWGGWVIWVGIVLGLISAIQGLRSSLKILERMGKGKGESEPPAVSFNEHD